MAIFLTGCTQAGRGIELTDPHMESTENVTLDIELQTESGSLAEDHLNPDGGDAEHSGDASPKDSDVDIPKTLYVYVCGAVVNPGVYELKEGCIIDDALEAAGGFSSDADRTYVNLAARLTDGVKLRIPTLEETASKEGNPEDSSCSIESFDKEVYEDGSSGKDAASSGQGLININKASREQLTSIPGIGDVTASKIVKYREENGEFKNIEDIMKVSGIKDKLFSKIQDYITV